MSRLSEGTQDVQDRKNVEERYDNGDGLGMLFRDGNVVSSS